MHKVVQLLETLGRPVAEPANMLVNLIISRLESQTRKALELSLGTGQEFTTHSTLTEFLEARFDTLEALLVQPMSPVAPNRTRLLLHTQ